MLVFKEAALSKTDLKVEEVLPMGKMMILGDANVKIDLGGNFLLSMVYKMKILNAKRPPFSMSCHPVKHTVLCCTAKYGISKHIVQRPPWHLSQERLV